MKIIVPGKIFISGEYAALKGLPALTVAVNPGFEFDKLGSGSFHPDSPAGRKNPSQKVDIKDPYKGVGGLGKSTAEFIVASGLNQKPWEMWKEYREILCTQKNTPSGVDLLTQLTGGYCLIETLQQSITKLEWPFANLDWLALVTGNKIKTHEHLQANLNLDWKTLERLNSEVIRSFTLKNSESFIQNLNLWRDFLYMSKLETSATTELVDLFLEMPGVLAVKGCGALGSDVVLIVFEKGNREVLEKSLEFWNSQHIIRSNQLSFDGAKELKSHESISTL